MLDPYSPEFDEMIRGLLILAFDALFFAPLLF